MSIQTSHSFPNFRKPLKKALYDKDSFLHHQDHKNENEVEIGAPESDEAELTGF